MLHWISTAETVYVYRYAAAGAHDAVLAQVGGDETGEFSHVDYAVYWAEYHYAALCEGLFAGERDVDVLNLERGRALNRDWDTTVTAVLEVHRVCVCIITVQYYITAF